jgi:CO/xanthine dehydrogenase FAD-binding subunit
MTTIADLEAETSDSIWGKALRNVITKFGSPNIRSVATVGGNICAASSSEDLIPVFLALDANVKIIGKGTVREQTLQDFIVAKRQTTLIPEEILAEISFPEPDDRSAFSFQKLGMRNILIIALVSVSVFLETDQTRSKIVTARVALNRLKGKIPERARSVEKELLEHKLDEKAIEAAATALAEELSLTSDFRASAQYRSEAAKVLLRRALLDCQNQLTRK